MRDFFRSLRFKILVAVLTVMLGFMIAAIYSGGTAPILSQVVGTITQPFQRLSTSITGGVTGFFDKYLQTGRTYEENAILREEIAGLRRQLVDYEKIKHEYEQLQEIAHVREQRQDLSFATASVIERDYSGPFATFTIDKGSLEDIKAFDPVMTADGLVGYVVEVGLTSSRVMTLLDVNMNVGASNSSTRDIGNITGRVDLAPEGLCKMEYLPRDSETAPGNIIVTSGGSIFPKDLVIGVVESVSTSAQGNSLEATVRLSADVRSVKDVFVITHFEGQGMQ